AGIFDFSATNDRFFSIVVPPPPGVNATWDLTTGGTWASSSSWSGGLPNAVTNTATLGSKITANSIVTLDGDKTVGKLTFNNANRYTLNAGTGGKLIIDDTGNIAGENPSINVTLGNHTIGAPVQLVNGATFTTAASTSLTVSGAIS